MHVVLIGFAIGVALRRGLRDRVPAPFVHRWNEKLTEGVSVSWNRFQVDAIRRKPGW